MTLAAPVTPRLTDPDMERVRRTLIDKIGELQDLPAASMRIIAGVTLVDSVATPIAHGLGRPPVWVRESAPRDATTTGRVVEIRDATANRAEMIILKATGWGATITVDVAVM